MRAVAVVVEVVTTGCSEEVTHTLCKRSYYANIAAVLMRQMRRM